MSVRVVRDVEHQIMAFIESANVSGYEPNADQVTAWLKSREPEVESSMLSTLASMQNMLKGVWIRRAETEIDHLHRIGWIVDGQNRGLKLTGLGRALLRTADRDDDVDDAVTVVLDSADPMVYARLMGELAGMGPGLLVDPYLKLDGIDELIRRTQLDRLLMSSRPHGADKAIAGIGTLLASTQLGRDLDVRSSASSQLHDRIVVTDQRGVFTIGTSLNAIGKRPMVISPVPEPAADVLRKLAEQWWEEGTSLRPTAASAGDANVPADDVEVR